MLLGGGAWVSLAHERLQEAGRVAERARTCTQRPANYSQDEKRGDCRAQRSDDARGDVNSDEYRRRERSGKPERVRSVPRLLTQLQLGAGIPPDSGEGSERYQPVRFRLSFRPDYRDSSNVVRPAQNVDRNTNEARAKRSLGS